MVIIGVSNIVANKYLSSKGLFLKKTCFQENEKEKLNTDMERSVLR